MRENFAAPSADASSDAAVGFGAALCLPLGGIPQFHPESIASVAGYRILAQFLEICGHGITSGETLDRLEAQILRLDQRFPDQMHA